LLLSKSHYLSRISSIAIQFEFTLTLEVTPTMWVC